MSNEFRKTNMKSATEGYDLMGQHSPLWVADPGVHYVRILPAVGNMAINDRPSFYSPFSLHWGIGNTVIPCRRRMGLSSQCPVCAYASKLPEKEAKPLWPSWSAYMNILLMNSSDEPERGNDGQLQFKVWRVGRENLGKIIAAVELVSDTADDLLDITDLDQGWTLRVKRTGKTMEDTKWDIGCIKSGQSSITEYLEEEGVPPLPDLSTFVPFLEPEEIVALLTNNADPFATAPAPARNVRALAAPRADEDDEDDDEDEEEEKPVRSSGQERLKALMEKARTKKGKD